MDFSGAPWALVSSFRRQLPSSAVGSCPKASCAFCQRSSSSSAATAPSPAASSHIAV